MVAGHLQEKNDLYYIVLSYKDKNGKRKTKWESTGLPVKKNKKKAEALLQERRRNFIPPVTLSEVRLDDDILFADFMLKWLEIAKSSIQITTYASYQGMVERVIAPYLCVDEVGNIIRPNYVSEQFPKLLKSNGLRPIRFHDLRHSCASLLLANGVPMKQIQEWLGHSDFSTTANIYAHLDYTSKLSSAQAMLEGLGYGNASA